MYFTPPPKKGGRATGVYDGLCEAGSKPGRTRRHVVSGFQKGGHAGSRRRVVIGLDLRLGPIQRKCGQACNLVAQKS
jgi:hypothetical protein